MGVQPQPSPNYPEATQPLPTAAGRFVITKDYHPETKASPDVFGGASLITSFKSSNLQQKFHERLTKFFYKLGAVIALYPSYFIIVPIFLSLLGFTGLQRIYTEEDTETLFYPQDGLAPYERAVVEEYFPMNSSSHFLPFHLTRNRGFTRVLIEAIDKKSIFRKHLWDEVLLLDKAIRSFKITHEEKTYTYENLCAVWNGKCFENLVLDLYEDIDEIENGTLQINYPLMIFPLVVPMFFGGISLDQPGEYIASAKALNLNYFLRHDTHEEKERDLVWEKEFISLLGKMKFQYLSVSQYAARSIQDLANESPNAVLPYVPSIIILMVLFSMGNSMMMDCVRSKFYLGLIGIISASMGTGAAFGFLMYLGMPNTGINNIIPFLMIGIGLDDMFVVLAAWRRTSLQDEVPKRLALTYADAGVSITITSLTNMVSFATGVATPILAVRIFCIYTALSVLITYLWHLTFFGGCLALSGYFEKDQRHSVLCRKVTARSKTESDRRCYSLWCSGGINVDDPWNPKDNERHVVMLFFKNYLGKMLTNIYVKGLVGVVFIAYLCGAIYGCCSITEGLARQNMVRYDSYIVNYFDMEDNLFRQHPYQIQVVITGNLLYSDKLTRKKIMALHNKFESLSFIAEEPLTQSWMSGWFSRLERRPSLASNVTNESEFIKLLRKNYLSGEGNMKALDVAFNEDRSRIVASRFILQTLEIKDTNADKDMMFELRKIADESPLNVTVFNPNFIFFDQYAMVRSVVIQSTIIAAVAMILISLVFIPNRWCSLHVGFAIVSIEIGVIGYMSLWNVNLDPISMLTLIMCIGFSVDFSAHISYAYLTSKAKTPDEKMRECLYCLGLPIIQGGLSTIVSIAMFILVPSYAYVAFFKVVFLVVLFASMHGLFLIPVLLSIAGPDALKKYRKNKISFTADDRNSHLQLSVAATKSCSLRGIVREKGVIRIKIDNCTFDDISNKQKRDDPEGCSNEEFSIEEESKENLQKSESETRAQTFKTEE